MKLSTHFTFEEATVSSTAKAHGIKNIPLNGAIQEALKHTASKMEQVRVVLDHSPILINSWYRNPEVNSLVGGSPTSDHMSGYSVDFRCPKFGTPLEVCMKLIDSRNVLQYDQLIYEGNWVHISFAPRARVQTLTKLISGGYTPGLVATRRLV